MMVFTWYNKFGDGFISSLDESSIESLHDLCDNDDNDVSKAAIEFGETAFHDNDWNWFKICSLDIPWVY